MERGCSGNATVDSRTVVCGFVPRSRRFEKY